MDLGDAKAELDDGLIYMMAGGTELHARIAANVMFYLGPRLRGSSCRPYGSDLATRTGERSIRFPDVSVYCGDPANSGDNRRQLVGDPQIVFEVLSPSTAAHDQKTKLEEYRSLPGIREIVMIDPEREAIRLVGRTPTGGWTDEWLPASDDLALASIGITIPRAEIFASD